MTSTTTLTLRNMNWGNLKDQKKALFAMSWNPTISSPELETIDEILAILDQVQDAAFATGQFREEDIYIQDEPEEHETATLISGHAK